MAAIVSFLWITGFVLSFTLAPQLRVWSWGPAMACFGLATIFAIPLLWREKSTKTDFLVIVSGLLLSAWIAIRSAMSPVLELAQSDLLLTAMAVATFICFRAVSTRQVALRILVIGLGLALAASVWVVGKQVIDPTYSPIFPQNEARSPAGFFAHYSYGASLLIPVSLFCAAFATFSKEHWFIRILLAVVALTGFVAVYYTKSRGGFIGLAVGVAALGFMSVLAAREKKAFPFLVIGYPVVLLLFAAFAINALSEVQEARSGDGNLTQMLDNTIRLYMFGMAVSCIALHPWIGGGSRSFSWECYRFWDVQAMGHGGAKPEHVHNELLQTAVDYGIIGACLLILFCVVAMIIAVVRTFSNDEANPSINAARIAGFCGFLGLFAQSNFEGIFRLPSGAILLGLCLAAASSPRLTPNAKKSARALFSNSVISLSGCAALVALLIFGWKGILVSREVWPVYFSKILVPTETRLDRLTSAIGVWPLGSLYALRATTYQKLASADEADRSNELSALALADYRSAAGLHPFAPEHAVNIALLAAFLGNEPEAESEFRRAIDLEGEMEAAFNARYYYSRYLFAKGLRSYDKDNPLPALDLFQLSSNQLGEIVKLHGHLSGNDRRALHVTVHESLGQTYQDLEDFEKALEEYDFAASLPLGTSAHYHAGLLLGKRAVKAWYDRKSSSALRLFIEAEARIGKSRNLPEGVDQEDRAAYLKYLRSTIKYMQSAKIRPSAKIDL